MKRMMKVSSIIVVLIVLLAACSGSASPIDKEQEKDSNSENVVSQDQGETVLSKSSEEKTDESKAEDTQEQESNSAAQEDGIQQDGTYINHQYGFSIDIPEHWMEHLVIESGYWAAEADHSIDFFYVADEDVIQLLFSIVVYDQVIEESQWDNPIWSYIGIHNGKTYASAIAGEPSETILEEKNKEHFEAVKIMINEEMLDVLDTFQFIDS